MDFMVSRKLLIAAGGTLATVLKRARFLGTEENSMIIEVLTKNETLIKAVAQAIKKQNKQDAVLVTSHDVDCTLV